MEQRISLREANQHLARYIKAVEAGEKKKNGVKKEEWGQKRRMGSGLALRKKNAKEEWGQVLHCDSSFSKRFTARLTVA